MQRRKMIKLRIDLCQHFSLRQLFSKSHAPERAEKGGGEWRGETEQSASAPRFLVGERVSPRPGVEW